VRDPHEFLERDYYEGDYGNFPFLSWFDDLVLQKLEASTHTLNPSDNKNKMTLFLSRCALLSIVSNISSGGK
jgi:hypothetical protein